MHENKNGIGIKIFALNLNNSMHRNEFCRIEFYLKYVVSYETHNVNATLTAILNRETQ